MKSWQLIVVGAVGFTVVVALFVVVARNLPNFVGEYAGLTQKETDDVKARFELCMNLAKDPLFASVEGRFQDCEEIKQDLIIQYRNN